MLLTNVLNRVIKVGTLNLIDAYGKKHIFKGADGPSVSIRLHDPSLPRKIAFNPQLHAGEAYMNGSLTVEDAGIYDFLDFMARNIRASGGWASLPRLKSIFDFAVRNLHQFNPEGWARYNVAHHYDLSEQFYDLFLDADKQYSCAYFEDGTETLETAQDLKKRHIAAKLLLQPGQRVLDIGSGWGGMGFYLAENADVTVTGVTLSTEQLKASRRRAAAKSLDGRVEFHLRDYRKQEGIFDRIVSVGMFEHVGVRHYGEFFSKVNRLLKDDGVALLHTIGRLHGPGVTCPWIRKYIFPGGYNPALSEIVTATEKCGLYVTDVETLRLHYAETLKRWRRRFLANRDQAARLYDERFCRMWEYYLSCSEVAFRHLGLAVFQIQLAKNMDSVPLSRTYIGDWESNRKIEPRKNIRAA